ncbi:MAG: PAS domain S-box protein, partial [Magnetococcales bacterium]|nr:PAS domain S-box protein [Magnetococcales bacterium]
PIQYVAGFSGDESVQRMQKGELDVVLNPLQPSDDTHQVVFTTAYPGSPMGLALPGSRVMLRDLLQKAMSRITPEEMKRLQDKWPQIKSSADGGAPPLEAADRLDRLRLTGAEKSWLRQHPKVRLGVEHDYPPVEFVQGGKYSGMSADFIALIARMTGLTLEPDPERSWSQGLDAAREGGIDLLPAVTNLDDRVDFLHRTDPYITFPVVVVTHRDGPLVSGLEDLEGQMVGVVRGHPIASLLARNHPRLQLVPVENVSAALEALDARRIDAVVENSAAATYEMNQHKLERLQIVAPTPYQMAFSFGVREDWPELKSILQKALEQISVRERTAIRNTWMVVQVQLGSDLKSILLWVVPVGLLLTLIITVIAFWNRRLGREISERKQAELALELAEERSRLLLESVGEGIFGVDLEGHFNFINPAGAAMLGYAADAMIGRKICLLLNHQDVDGASCLHDACALRQAIGQELLVQRTDEPFWRRDGSCFTVEYTSQPIWKQGALIGSVVVFRDITERIQTEQKIRTLSSAVEQSPVSIVIVDPMARIEYVNPTFTEVSGYSAEEVMGRNPRILQSGKTEVAVYRELWATLGRGETWEGEFLNRRKSGALYWEATTISPILDRNGRLIHYLANKEDITPRKLAEAQLRDAVQLISSSIQYASRIQRSILAAPGELASVLPEQFALWEPRDVVGGDMYWYRPWFMGVLLLLGDCTGHGVPGAFITLIANGALDQALLETPPGETTILLQRMHQLLQAALGQDREEGASNDGLELGICYLDPEQQTLTFSGARFSLFVVKEEGSVEVKGEKSGIGYRGLPRDLHFASNTVELRGAWRYYMTSDGLIDQVGGEKRRGFGKKRFMQLLEELRPFPMGEHGMRIQQALVDYQGGELRRDDVAVVGFKGIVNGHERLA